MTRNTKDLRRERSKQKSPETLRDKVQRHLRDKNDVITDEDILDTIVGADDSEKSSRINGEATGKNEIAENTDNDNEKPKDTTPWNILSEGYD
jgi:hypothetical protein